MDIIIRLFQDSYLSLIKNSIGTKMFRNFYVETLKGKKDLLNDGELSCAYFVSSVLRIFDWIDSIHMTVDSTEKDIKNNGWQAIPWEDRKPGGIIIWKEIKIGDEYHKHIGFYIGNNKAVSASYKLKRVVSHDFTFGGEREIEAIYWKDF